MTQEDALKAFEEMYGEIDKENWLFVGTINPQMVEHAIKALSIVRCKDCRWYDHGENELEEWFGCKTSSGLLHPMPDEFCSRAERK